MTTTIAELPQCVPQEEPQIGPAPGDPLPTTTPDPTSAQHPALTKAERNGAQLRALSKTFGHIPNVPIFTHWISRRDCSHSAVHRSNMAGICGNGTDGAYSVSLSNKYKDNEDGGDIIIYTGTGGRQRWTNAIPPKRLRVGPQTENQSWEHPCNKALMVSYLTGNPLRVIRSSQSASHYAPLKGYRYDGLYKVAAYWTAKGRNGKDVCRCRLERLPGQPPIPQRPITMPALRRCRGHPLSAPCPSSTSCSTNTDACPPKTGDNQPSEPTESGVQMINDTGGVLDQHQQHEISQIPNKADFDMGELEVDEKPHPPPPPSQPRSSPKPGTMTRYRWNSRTNQLIRIPVADPDRVPATEEDRAADDATLVQSEDGRSSGRETEFFSDFGDPDGA